MRRAFMAGAALLLVVAPIRAVSAQYRGVRFEIIAVSDTTFSFKRGAEVWVKPGLTGIAVDPRRRDALVARFRVLTTTGEEATAVITGQTTNVRDEHVAVLEAPRRPWYRNGSFWGGVVLGAAIGATVGFAR